jgi:hypothetical protein
MPSTPRAWIFQATLKTFDVDGFLDQKPEPFLWRVSRYEDEIDVGDQVFLWRAEGGSTEPGGVIAECVVVERARPQPEDMASRAFWRSGDPNVVDVRARLRLVRRANKKQVIKRDWLKEDPVLSQALILRFASGTNYPLTEPEADRLRALWSRTGEDWTRAEVIAALRAYDITFGKPISRLAGEPVADTALLIGRAVGGVYNKLMNLRALDPRSDKGGLPSTAAIDAEVFDEFYDPAVKRLRSEAVEAAFHSLWSASTALPEAGKVHAAFEEKVAERAEETLAQLYARIQAKAPKPGPAAKKMAATTVYYRDEDVAAYTLVRAGWRCESPGCAITPFLGADGRPYCEVHHLDQLAHGGNDAIENTACLCPQHHREIHYGRDKAKLTKALKALRAAERTKVSVK